MFDHVCECPSIAPLFETRAITLGRALDAWREAGALIGTGKILPDGRLAVHVQPCPLLDVWRAGGAPAGWALIEDRDGGWALWQAAP